MVSLFEELGIEMWSIWDIGSGWGLFIGVRNIIRDLECVENNRYVVIFIECLKVCILFKVYFWRKW